LRSIKAPEFRPKRPQQVPSARQTGGDDEILAASGSISWGIVLILLGRLFPSSQF